MSSGFLPTDYELPKSLGNYTSLQDGENTVRVLSSAIIGYLYWNNDKKPIRSKEYPKELINPRIDKDGKSKVKHFWAFVVFNEHTKTLQVMEITQKTIMEGVKALVDNTKWGDPKNYDISITRSGEGLDTTYSVVPNPKEEISEEIATLYQESDIKLEALYKGEDPFGNATATTTAYDEIKAEDIPFN